MLEVLIFPIIIYIALVISSIPMWVASKILGVRRSSIGRAVVATFGGGLISILVWSLATPIAPFNVVLALITYLWVLKVVYDVGWLASLLLFLVSILVVVILLAILALLALIPAFMMGGGYRVVPPGPPWA